MSNIRTKKPDNKQLNWENTQKQRHNINPIRSNNIQYRICPVVLKPIAIVCRALSIVWPFVCVVLLLVLIVWLGRSKLQSNTHCVHMVTDEWGHMDRTVKGKEGGVKLRCFLLREGIFQWLEKFSSSPKAFSMFAGFPSLFQRTPLPSLSILLLRHILSVAKVLHMDFQFSIHSLQQRLKHYTRTIFAFVLCWQSPTHSSSIQDRWPSTRSSVWNAMKDKQSIWTSLQ